MRDQRNQKSKLFELKGAKFVLGNGANRCFGGSIGSQVLENALFPFLQ
jgi:hypothetical protein